jgi:hypothetical protein
MSSTREPGIDVAGATLASKPTPVGGGPADAGADPTLAADGNPATTRPGDLAELEPGTVIARYRIVARLGAGGMGVVYRAHDAQLDREVALKLLRVGEDGTEGRSRMLREAKAAAKIRHPNVVTVYDAGEVFGRVFIAMELIDGVTLKSHFRGRRRGWREVVAVMLGAGEGLAAAHQAGLVHRDFKPKSRRPSQTAPQPTDRPHSHSQGRFERVDVDRAAPGRPGVPHVLAKRWQRAGPPEDQRGHGPRNTCWCVVGPLPIMTDAVQRFTSAVPRRKPCGQ